ncbi:hypothetical protein C731_1906 [Mycolicibacterium hassiacum DSM 44199]|jgi:hypothetical protein|uniref:Uncharacterized protein n=1 Tax=Mycolicibacterium hassiacum (strain DSM 44199 / CIP 105218 / JCM 12690 / 3849) TaxID=1122247 RepID=K5BGM5_MYCHD|nr:hypothetical protein [Mycolicibacterium hassiacum]EKF24146.1 hypothetical protein C731_1906 [Mycolicibacterium hassiacum DSM 44199]MDA4085104.1 hypothetical protein [Mycolicibacterium hassiacum DSM 44199]VCT90615.1 hypothetical protein MHAS_02324 [Mycolicibacterium hassiacum DSM 44199]
MGAIDDLQVRGRAPMVFGRPSELFDAITAAGPGPQADAAMSIVAVVDRDLVRSLFAAATPGHTRRPQRAWQQLFRERLTAAAIGIAAQRLLIVCDVRRISAEQRRRAADWVRRLAHRIGYECSINGLHGLATVVAFVETDAGADEVARTVARWAATPAPAAPGL